jgi:hypothetical protein
MAKRIKNPMIVILTYTNIMDVSNNLNSLGYQTWEKESEGGKWDKDNHESTVW